MEKEFYITLCTYAFYQGICKRKKPSQKEFQRTKQQIMDLSEEERGFILDLAAVDWLRRYNASNQ